MILSEFIEMQKVKPWKWADQVSLPRSRVYAWLKGEKPGWKYLMLIKKVTKGAVNPEDFGGLQ